ncbi:hypothetical protein [Providencia manganoxydans]|uniref:hypothetical protein n=1 Tax=Providencia manganoxydans TaxID=2923283 RepID=UPI0029C03B41|nr:hypothetical protein [Providencia manganoxydans]MDX4948063.1 hypothetical protein [Providencia manganoxydans]
MSFYDLYAFNGLCINEAKTIIEHVLDIKFEERESSFQGGLYYLSGSKGSENFILKKNVDPFDGEPSEMEHPESDILFYINDTNRNENLKHILFDTNRFVLLRTEEL